MTFELTPPAPKPPRAPKPKEDVPRQPSSRARRGQREIFAVAKPPYRVPTMGEIAAIPLNGFKVATTFAGGGGSSTGYRMAGFEVVWANEFVPAAQETY